MVQAGNLFDLCGVASGLLLNFVGFRAEIDKVPDTIRFRICDVKFEGGYPGFC